MTNKPIRVDDRLRRANRDDDEHEYEEVTEERGCSGCAWGLVGVVGCLGIPIGVLLFVLIGGANIIGNIFNSIGQIFNPPPPTYTTIETPAVIELVRELSTLNASEYTFSRMITSERELPPLLQALYYDRLIYYAVGSIQAGVDISQIAENDIILQDTTLTIILPPPILTNCFIDESASRVLSRDTGVFANPAPNIESEARREALIYFRRLAIEDDILIQANDKAKETLQKLFGLVLESFPGITIETIEVITREPDLNNMVLPPACTR